MKGMAIEEDQNVSSMKVDELIGYLLIFEMHMYKILEI